MVRFGVMVERVVAATLLVLREAACGYVRRHGRVQVWCLRREGTVSGMVVVEVVVVCQCGIVASAVSLVPWMRRVACCTRYR